MAKSAAQIMSYGCLICFNPPTTRPYRHHPIRTTPWQPAASTAMLPLHAIYPAWSTFYWDGDISLVGLLIKEILKVQARIF